MELDRMIEKLELRMNRLISFLPERKRLYFDDLEEQFQNRAILLYGPRGVGKTTFLLFMAKKQNLLYISGDDPLLLSCPLHSLIEQILMNYHGIIIDEVHSLPNWSLILKNIYDSFPNRIVWASDSSSVILRQTVVDLSRRFVLIKLPLMSLREYIYLETGKVIDRLRFPSEDLLGYATEVMRQVDVMNYFKDYREKGTRPFYTEGNFREKMMNILEKTIYYDITHFVGAVSDNHFGVMKAIISHLLYSEIPTINVESMCKEWSIGKPKLYQLLRAMEQVGLINIVPKGKVERPYSKGSKMFFADPTLYYVFEGEVGNFREAFTVFTLKEKGKIWAAKNEHEADFIFEGLKLEVGGRQKSSKSSDFVLRDDIDFPLRNVIPLWMLGMLW